MTVLDRATRRWRLGSGDVLVAPPEASTASTAARAAVLRRLELEVTRRLDGLLTGDHLSASHGPGSERAGARPYGPGDDARRIDWSLTARIGQAHVRTTEADRELETWLVVDRSASLDFGTALREKRDVVLGAMAGFGFLGLRAGNRVGAVVSGGDRIVRVPARSGRPALLAALAITHDTERREGPPAGGADLGDALATVQRGQARRGRVVVISDFLGEPTWVVPLARLARRHEVIAVHVTDPRELDLPAVGMLTVVDVESGRQLHVQSDLDGLRTRYAEAARERHEAVARNVATAGASHLRLSTGRDLVVDLAAFVGRHGTAR